MDYGMVVAKHEVLRKVLNFLNSDACQALGIHLSLPKTEVWWSTPPCDHDRGAYPLRSEEIPLKHLPNASATWHG